jgi:thioredoxin 1
MKHMLYFTADWCNPCKKVRPIVEELKREEAISVIYVDVDDNIELCETYEIKSIPTFLILEDGIEVNRMTGAKTKEEFQKLISD